MKELSGLEEEKNLGVEHVDGSSKAIEAREEKNAEEIMHFEPRAPLCMSNHKYGTEILDGVQYFRDYLSIDEEEQLLRLIYTKPFVKVSP